MIRLRRRTRGCAVCVLLSSTPPIASGKVARIWPSDLDRVELVESGITEYGSCCSLVHAGQACGIRHGCRYGRRLWRANKTSCVGQSCATRVTIHTHFKPLFELVLVTHSAFNNQYANLVIAQQLVASVNENEKAAFRSKLIWQTSFVAASLACTDVRKFFCMITRPWVVRMLR
jgi:hypothetical protein